MQHFTAVALSLILVGVSMVQAEPDAEQTRKDFEQVASELSYLCVPAVIHDRTDHFFRVADSEEKKKHFRLLEKISDRAYPKDALLGLLAHKDAKVRTLAAVALYDREDPSVLPQLVELTKDRAATFEGHPELAKPLDWSIGPPAKEQTVGEIAEKMVTYYLRASGFHYGIKHERKPGFAEYWEARKDRSHCVGWFEVQLDRAGQGVIPVGRERAENIRELRKRIDKLPLEERTWVLIRLHSKAKYRSKWLEEKLVPEKELVELCQAVGRDKLLAVLQGTLTSKDPDFEVKRLRPFLLGHAEALFGPGDHDALLKLYRARPSPQGAIAAARLAPEKASDILKAANRRFQGKYDRDKRGQLSLAIWQLCGEAEMPFLVEWFYTESPQRGSFPNCLGAFIEAVKLEPEGGKMLAALIKDKRLEKVDWQTLERMTLAVDGLTERQILDPSSVHVWHPQGKGHYHWMKEESKKQYPKETAELESHLQNWREGLKKSLPELLK